MLVLAAIVLAGCGFLSGANKTRTSLQHAGYRNVGVNIQSGSGTPRDGLVNITYSAGPTGDDNRDAYNAARVVWETFGYRFGALAITKTSGGCAGPFCVSHNTGLGAETYQQMLAQFGPRPANLDTKSADNAQPFPIWIIPVGLLVVVVAAIAVIVVVVVRKRRHPRLPPPWTGYPPPPAPYGWGSQPPMPPSST